MARKKKGDSGSIIFFIVIVVLVAIALATPIALIIGYLYNKINAGRIKKYISGNMSDFWLDDQEKIEFKDKLKHLVKADKIIDQANQ
jgi:cell division protein FtsL